MFGYKRADKRIKKVKEQVRYKNRVAAVQQPMWVFERATVQKSMWVGSERAHTRVLYQQDKSTG